MSIESSVLKQQNTSQVVALILILHPWMLRYSHVLADGFPLRRPFDCPVCLVSPASQITTSRTQKLRHAFVISIGSRAKDSLGAALVMKSTRRGAQKASQKSMKSPRTEQNKSMAFAKERPGRVKKKLSQSSIRPCRGHALPRRRI